MFKIYDGRKEFYQWDLDQKLIVTDPTVNEVHFCNQTDDCALVCEVYDEGELRVVDVPNILLQTSWPIRAYAHCDCATKTAQRFEVIPRSKPADYVYTETEVRTWEELNEKIENLELGAVVNADYEENDPESKSFIENRPFYKYLTSETNVYEGGEQIAIDGIPWVSCHVWCKASSNTIPLHNFESSVVSYDDINDASGRISLNGSYSFNFEELDIVEKTEDFVKLELFPSIDNHRRHYLVIVYSPITLTINGSESLVLEQGVYTSISQLERIDGDGVYYIRTLDNVVIKHTPYIFKSLDNKFLDLPNNSDFIELEGRVSRAESAVSTVETNLESAISEVEANLEEVESIAKGAQQAVSYSNYSTMVKALNDLPNDTYLRGQNIMIVTLEVPDLWVSKIAYSSIAYTYVDDATIVEALKTTGYIQVGYYRLSALETGKIDLTEYVKTDDFESAIGDIETALDGIITLQESYIGGEA